MRAYGFTTSFKRTSLATWVRRHLELSTQYTWISSPYFSLHAIVVPVLAAPLISSMSEALHYIHSAKSPQLMQHRKKRLPIHIYLAKQSQERERHPVFVHAGPPPSPQIEREQQIQTCPPIHRALPRLHERVHERVQSIPPSTNPGQRSPK